MATLVSHQRINDHLLFAHPEYPVEVFLVHAKEVAVVLSQDDGGSAGRICNQGQLPKVITLMERTHHTLGHTQDTLQDTNELRHKHGLLVILNPEGKSERSRNTQDWD